jgi:hypothetical protein
MGAGALAVAGLVHFLDAPGAQSNCQRDSAKASPPEVVDFLFAPASAWRHFSQEQQLDAMLEKSAREGR